MEIERKFLFDKIPKELSIVKKYYVEQGYLSIEPEVRIRKKQSDSEALYIICIKSNGELIREEVEINIPQGQYNTLKNIIDKEFITKEFYEFKLYDGNILEFSIVDKEMATEFMYGEVEFMSVEDANNFKVPEFFGQEVTYDKDYKMKNYWKKTRI